MSAPGPQAVGAQPPGTATVPRGLRFTALEVPAFRWYWIASAISITGDGMETVLRNWLVWELTRSPLWLGLMVFAHWVPFTVFSLYGGVLADRYENRKVQIAAQLLLLAAAVGVAVATLAGLVTEWWIFGWLLLHGFAGAIGNPAQQTLVHDLVGPGRLLSAVSLNSAARTVTQVVGPVVAGAMLVTFGAGLGFLVNALTFLPLLGVLLLLRLPRRLARRQGTRESFTEAARFIRSRPVISSVVAVEMVPVVFLGHAFHSLIPVFATDVLHTAELGYAFLLTANGAGALVAAVFLAYAREVGAKGRFIVGAAAIEAVAVFVFALSTNYALSLALLVLVGAASVLTQAVANTTIQLSAPDELRGRVMGAYSWGTQGTRVVNGPLLGGAALAVGAPLALAASALAVVGALAAVWARVPHLRRLD